MAVSSPKHGFFSIIAYYKLFSIKNYLLKIIYQIHQKLSIKNYLTKVIH